VIAIPLGVESDATRTLRWTAIAVIAAATVAGVGSALEWFTVSLEIPMQSASGLDLPLAGWLIGLTTLASVVSAALLLVRPRWVPLAWTAGGLGLLAATLSGLAVVILAAGQQTTHWIPHQLLPDDWRYYTPELNARAGIWIYFLGCIAQCVCASRYAFVSFMSARPRGG
jgi:hypothetical protein